MSAAPPRTVVLAAVNEDGQFNTIVRFTVTSSAVATIKSFYSRKRRSAQMSSPILTCSRRSRTCQRLTSGKKMNTNITWDTIPPPNHINWSFAHANDDAETTISYDTCYNSFMLEAGAWDTGSELNHDGFWFQIDPEEKLCPFYLGIGSSASSTERGTTMVYRELRRRIRVWELEGYCVLIDEGGNETA
ncbi:hypothetical protein LTR56_016756 [Elasticomyces elasticus]|nr:hypothetical protein LTR56_016756 [Elasticomyces elasticus]KAK3662723.1 hypothetical protein LTR22_006574 [Elasticomyces elasticus]KAK4923377.1 hypothetical protein LTR49_009447 [Elasticomyces elasticus]KAK5753282.1 hypothetical protein LTS12_016618 [Elasticomyces elasticus]